MVMKEHTAARNNRHPASSRAQNPFFDRPSSSTFRLGSRSKAPLRKGGPIQFTDHKPAGDHFMWVLPDNISDHEEYVQAHCSRADPVTRTVMSAPKLGTCTPYTFHHSQTVPFVNHTASRTNGLCGHTWDRPWPLRRSTYTSKKGYVPFVPYVPRLRPMRCTSTEATMLH